MFCWSTPTSSGMSTPKLHLTEYTVPVGWFMGAVIAYLPVAGVWDGKIMKGKNTWPRPFSPAQQRACFQHSLSVRTESAWEGRWGRANSTPKPKWEGKETKRAFTHQGAWMNMYVIGACCTQASVCLNACSVFGGNWGEVWWGSRAK